MKYTKKGVAKEAPLPIDGVYGIHNTARPYEPIKAPYNHIGGYGLRRTGYCNFIYYMYSMRKQHWLVSMLY